MTQQLGLNGRASFPVRRLGTLWRNPGWRDVITAWCRFPLGQATFNMSTFEWMSSCRIDEVSECPPTLPGNVLGSTHPRGIEIPAH